MKHFAKALLAAVTAVTVAAPIPAAPPAGAAAGKTPVHHSATRFRGVPTFANSTLADIGTFDDPIVREAAVEGLGRYNGAVVAVNPNTGTLLTVNSISNTISVLDTQTLKTIATMGVIGSTQFAAAIHPLTNMAVITDSTNNRLLILPLPN